MIRTTVFWIDGIQAVSLPDCVAFPAGAREVVVRRDGARRIIVPANSGWDDFFGTRGIDLGDRSQPAAEDGEAM